MEKEVYIIGIDKNNVQVLETNAPFDVIEKFVENYEKERTKDDEFELFKNNVKKKDAKFYAAIEAAGEIKVLFDKIYCLSKTTGESVDCIFDFCYGCAMIKKL